MRMTAQHEWFRIGSVLMATLFVASSVNARQRAKTVDSHLVYVGTYTVRGSRGVYAFKFGPNSGRLRPMGLHAEIANPSFLAVDNTGRFLYTVSEISNYKGQNSGAILAYGVNQETAQLKHLNQVASLGAGPCYVSLDKSGKYLLVANFQGGSVVVFPILKGGHLGSASAFIEHHGSGADPVRQTGPHAHSIATTPDNRFAIAADLGLDKLLLYRFEADKGSLIANDPPSATIAPGAGPRHFVFHPNGDFLYVVNEMASTVSVFSYENRIAKLSLQQTISTLPEGFAGVNEAADIHMDVAGKFLYASNRGQDTIKIFAVDAGRGTLTSVDEVATGGKTPRSFAIDPSGRYLIVANEDSDNLVTFRIDPKTGRLHRTANVVNVPSPVCIAFLRR